MTDALESLHEIARLNHRLFHNCLEDLDEASWSRRVEGHANSMAFLALHLVGARHYLAKTMGVEVTLPSLAAYENVNKVEEMEEIPSIADVKTGWDEASRALRKAFETVGEDQLAEDIKAPFPTGNTTRMGAVNFLVSHESYHLGQLAFLRRCYGMEPMSYR